MDYIVKRCEGQQSVYKTLVIEKNMIKVRHDKDCNCREPDNHEAELEMSSTAPRSFAYTSAQPSRSL